MSKGIVIAGTSPEVGKTYITALIIKALNKNNQNSGYYKAVSCGAIRSEEGLISPEASFICGECGLKEHSSQYVSYIYQTQASPHIAAIRAGVPIDLQKIEEDYLRLSKKYDYLCVESNGGMMCPLRIDGGTTVMMADALQKINLPLVLVASLETDHLNHILLTIQYIRSKHLQLKGIILNHYQPDSAFSQDKVKEYEEYLDIPIICTVKEFAKEIPLTKQELLELFD